MAGMSNFSASAVQPAEIYQHSYLAEHRLPEHCSRKGCGRTYRQQRLEKEHVTGRAQGQPRSRSDLQYHDPRLPVDVEILDLRSKDASTNWQLAIPAVPQ